MTVAVMTLKTVKVMTVIGDNDSDINVIDNSDYCESDDCDSDESDSDINVIDDSDD